MADFWSIGRWKSLSLWLFRPRRNSDPTRLPRPTPRPSNDIFRPLQQMSQAYQCVSVGYLSVFHFWSMRKGFGIWPGAFILSVCGSLPGPGGELEGGLVGPDPFASRWDAAEVSTASEFRSFLAASFRDWLCPPGVLRKLPRLALLLRCRLFAVPPPALMRLRHNAVHVQAVLAFVGGGVN